MALDQTPLHWAVLADDPAIVSLLLEAGADASARNRYQVPPIALAAVIRSWWGFFIHADLPWTLGPLGKVLMSPAAHRLHHIDDLVLCGANYGNTLTLWDRLFGTYVDPQPYLNCATGVCGGSRGLVGELARPFVRDSHLVPENAETATA